jgi:hypothetical protein
VPTFEGDFAAAATSASAVANTGSRKKIPTLRSIERRRRGEEEQFDSRTDTLRRLRRSQERLIDVLPLQGEKWLRNHSIEEEP